ncbi:MAG: AAA family ATPase [Candidatus Aenigmarchaeota archaeon]|nr:AAA family ATPase [Candidatus Aenigmarchaeota archaeon]
MEERVRTGIPGFDEVLNGGFLPSDLVLLTGATGTGKTVFATQFLYNSVKLYNSPSVYVSFEERPEDIKRNAMRFGWDFESFERKNLISFVRYDPLHIEDIYGLIENNIHEIGAERVVIDSITGLGLNIRDPGDLRAAIFNIGRMLKRSGCTSILTSEAPSENPLILSTFGVEEHVTDDVIVLYKIPKGTGFSRALTVWKMRGSVHSEKIHPYIITKDGIVVYAHDETQLFA